MCYLEQTQHTQTGHITRLTRIEEDHYVRLDRFTVRNLELIHPMFDDGKSLLDVIDRTLTPMGARSLHRWLLFPLRSVKDIQQRQDGVEYFFKEPEFRELCQDELCKIGDLERIVSKIAVGRVTPREMQQLRMALESVGLLREACIHASNKQMQEIGLKMDACKELHDRILHDLLPDPPALLNKGGVIAAGVCNELDELRSISTSGKSYLQHIQERESEARGFQQCLWLLHRSA